MLVRHADALRDASACAAIYSSFVCDSAVSFEEEAPGEHELAQRIERISLTHPWLVAEQAGSVVGFAYGAPHRARAAYRWAADVAVYVAEDSRGQGVGRALYETLLSALRGQGLYVACAGITLPNDPSVALHEACGFRPVGVYRRIGWKAGAWRDVSWWQALLRDYEGGPPADPGPPVQLR
jgi:L-amino acid N-acyltransferase YncA